jgi:hypothetical protein
VVCGVWGLVLRLGSGGCEIVDAVLEVGGRVVGVWVWVESARSALVFQSPAPQGLGFWVKGVGFTVSNPSPSELFRNQVPVFHGGASPEKR